MSTFRVVARTDTCILDEFFMKSDGYQSVKFDIYNNELEKTNNIYSLLPDIYITTGQSAHNDSGFRPPIYNLAGLSVSQSIYSGGSYINSREKLELNEKEFSRNISENRVLYILNIYADTLKIKSIDRLIGFYEERLSEQETEHKKLNVLYAQGDISENEVKLGLDEIRTYKDNISRFKMERDNVLMDLKEKYKLTPDLLQHITKETVRSCKREGLSSLLEKENAINKRRITLDHEIEKSYYYPNASLSFSLTPKDGGRLRDITFSEGQYVASINVSIPVSGLFKLTNVNNKFRTSLEQSDYRFDSKWLELMRKKRELESNVEIATRELESLKNKIAIKKNQLNYLRNSSQIKDDMQYSYHSEKERMQYLENLANTKETEIEINKMHLYYIN